MIGDVFAGKRGPVPIHGVEHNRVVAGFNGAIGDAHVLAAVGIDAVGPNGFIWIRVDVDAVDDQPFQA